MSEVTVDPSAYDASVPVAFERYSLEEQVRRARQFRELLERRRSVRAFSTEPVPRSLIVDLVRTAAASPSAANQQPWRFVIVSNPEIKREIRRTLEAAEADRVANRAPFQVKRHVPPIGARLAKAFVEHAPYVIVIFRIDYTTHTGDDGWAGNHTERESNFYVMESVGIATGLLVAAIHNAGLATVTHTPAPQGHLNEILGRPKNEHPFLILPVGYPAPEARAPDLRRKSFDEVALFVE